MKVIKRDCTEVDFDKSKISNAILKAMKNGSGIIKPKIAENIAEEIETELSNQYRDEIEISNIELMIYEKLISKKQKLTARAYEGYRSIREFQRENNNTTDEEISELLTGNSEYWATENSNKNEKLVTTQRDYMAGIVSKDISRRYLLTPEIVQAHDEGIIHFHDIDYFGQKALYNCCLINLEDMLQNGTVISGTLIEKPHSFSTACNIATQIIAQVASSQYGGQTISLSHLAPFVQITRNNFKEKYHNLISKFNDLDDFYEHIENLVYQDIVKGVQTIQYQIVTLMTTNGQAPFLSVFMYLDEVPEGQTRDDLAMIIEEVLKQRIKGTKNEKGVWITPAFPKLLYVLDEDNVHEDSKYWYLTELAAKCTAKRLVPDYISAKIMKELKGDVYPCMGCMDGREVVTYKYKGDVYTESFSEMWERLVRYYIIELQPNKRDYFMKTPGVKIYDQKRGLVDNYGIIKNHNSKWLKLTFSDKRNIICTFDHPFETKDGKIVSAKDLTQKDLISTDNYLTSFMKKNGNDIEDQEYIHITQKEMFFKEGFSYDVTTESEHFTVSGIYSHNCRSFLTVEDNIRNSDESHKFYGRLTMLG